MSAFSTNDSEAGPSTPPVYSQSSTPPRYSLDASNDEETLLQSSRHHLPLRPPPTGNFTHKGKSAVVVITEQEDGAIMPTFNGLRPISGVLSLDSRENIQEIRLNLKGTLDVHLFEGPGSTARAQKILDDSHVLWSRSETDLLPPSSLPFNISIPSSVRLGDETLQLPPSHNFVFSGRSGFLAESKYALRIIISKTRSPSRFCLTSKPIQRIKIPFTYAPRKRPHLPIISDASFFNSVKRSPEEWFAAEAALKARPLRGLSDIQVHLLIPSTRVFSMADKIPFHIQLSGSSRSMRELLHLPLTTRPVVNDDQSVSVLSSSTRSSTSRLKSFRGVLSGSQPNLAKAKEPFIQVHLQRFVSAHKKGATAVRSVCVGIGSVRSHPPSIDADEGEETISLDWEGDVQFNHDVRLGNFAAGGVTVKHVISFSIAPHNASSSPFIQLGKQVPIHLVTDPWSDMVSSDGRLSFV